MTFSALRDSIPTFVGGRRSINPQQDSSPLHRAKPPCPSLQLTSVFQRTPGGPNLTICDIHRPRQNPRTFQKSVLAYPKQAITCDSLKFSCALRPIRDPIRPRPQWPIAPLFVVQRTSPIVAIPASNSISPFRHLPIHPPPNRHHSRQVHPRKQGPQNRESSRQIPNGIRTPESIPLARHDPHLLHHLVHREIRIAFGNTRIMERKKPQPSPTIQSPQMGDLPRAKSALAIVQHGVLIEYRLVALVDRHVIHAMRCDGLFQRS